MYTTKEELENLRQWVYDKGYETGMRNGLFFAFVVIAVAFSVALIIR